MQTSLNSGELMKNIMLFIVVMLLSSCSHAEHNQMLMDMNQSRFEAYGTAMAKQTCEGGRLAIALAYSLGVGQQQLQREDTALDWVRGVGGLLNPWVALWFAGDSGRSNDSGDTIVGRDYVYQGIHTDDHSAYQAATSDIFTSEGGWTGSNDVDWLNLPGAAE